MDTRTLHPKTKLTIMQVFKKLLLSSLAFCCFIAVAMAQEKKVTGTVHTSNGLGIAGTSVQAKKSKRLVFTDNAGNFTLSIPQSETDLVISSLGFLTKEITIDGQDMNITLLDDPKQLTEVVVTAYGIKKESKRLGYASQ